MPTSPVTTPIAHRLWAAVCAIAILAVLVTAAMLDPDPAGHGTHTALGLPACGWAQVFNKPCATCGMTTAFAHAADARPVSAFRTQPAGAILAIFLATMFWIFSAIAALGTNLWPEVAKLFSAKGIWIGLTIIGFAWAYKFLTWPSG